MNKVGAHKKEKFRTIKLKQEKIFNCTENDKNCTEVHSAPVEIVEVKPKKSLAEISGRKQYLTDYAEEGG